MDNENGLKINQLTLLGQQHRLLRNVLQQFNPVIMYMPNIMNPKCVVTDLSNIFKT
jgi:hypothetical protein